MNSMNYAGLDIHKKSISCCVRQADGTIIQESTIAATRHALDEWMRRLALLVLAAVGGLSVPGKGRAGVGETNSLRLTQRESETRHELHLEKPLTRPR